MFLSVIKIAKRLLSAAILLIIAVITLSAANQPIFYEQVLTNNNGLSNSSVNTIFQDRDGLLWVGTWDGLNRCDGYDVRSFHHISGDTTSLSNSVIRQIFEEDGKYLWVSTDYGINRFDKYTGRCSRFFIDRDRHNNHPEKAFACGVDSHGQVFASLLEKGLFRYDRQQNRFSRMLIGDSPSQPQIRQLIIDDSDRIWVRTDKNIVFCLVPDNERHAYIQHKIALPNDATVHLRYDKSNRIWYTYRGTLYYININESRPAPASAGTGMDEHLQTVIAKGDTFYFGTSMGYYMLTPEGDLSRVNDINASVLFLCHGIQDIIWIGTDGKGVYKCFKNDNFITNITADNEMMKNIYAIRALTVDRYGSLWIGSKGGGLSRINHLGAKGLEKVDNYNVGSGHAYNAVLSLAQGIDRLWVGTDGYGLHYFDYTSQKVKTLDLSQFAAGRQIESIYSILQTDLSTLYLATSGHGLYKISLDKSQNVTAVTNYTNAKNDRTSIGSNIIYDIVDDDNSLWIATRGGGLCCFNKATETFASFTTTSTPDGGRICANDIISLFRDSDKNIWIGTTQGLCLLKNADKAHPKFSTFNQNIGLPNSNIHSIREDCNHDIWVSTSQGVSRINPDNLTVTSYFYEDGLQNSEFSDGAGFASADGTALYFGGIDGFNIIYPNRIVNDNFIPRLTLKEVMVGNSLYDFCDNTISTSSSDNTINISIAVIDYLDNRQCRLSYRLTSEGAFSNSDTNWIDLGTSRNILLNQLSPGRYTLSVRSIGASHVWSEPQTYTIIIAGPWWSTWWAVCLYLLLIGVIAALALRSWLARRRLNQMLDLQRREAENKEVLHDAKLKFFTNIAHEFSNSITLIYGAASQLLTAGGGEKKADKRLLTIQSNADRMRAQIQELMEFRKAETGYLSVNLNHVNVTQLIDSICHNFDSDIESQGISLTVNAPADDMPLTWIVDKNMFEKIGFNLMSNAIKYTPQHGRIIVDYAIADDNLVLKIANSGYGINPDDLNSIFNRFTILDNFEKKLSQGKYSRTGIGLALCKDLVTLMKGTINVESSINELTTFTVTLPRRSDDEITPTERNTNYTPTEFAPEPRLFDDQKLTILVVDDQPEICEMIKDIIGDEYDVVTANNGREALDRLQHSSPSLIVTDIIMPHMNGIEFVNSLKADDKTRYIPIIILSSKSGVESQIQALESGANMFIDKPFHPQHLKTAIDNILHNHNLMKRYSESSSAYKEKYNNTEISADDKAFIDSVIDVLSKNFANEDYSQEDLIRDLVISRTQLYRRIKKITGMSPGNFISAYRLGRAEHMLIHTDMTIKEIMIECGFHNKTYFYRVFQNANGCTPKEFRDNNRQ